MKKSVKLLEAAHRADAMLKSATKAFKNLREVVEALDERVKVAWSRWDEAVYFEGFEYGEEEED